MPVIRSLTPFFIFAAAYAALALVVSNSYYQLMMTLVLVWASFGLAWNLLSGYTGLVSFGHAAFFGIGAYTTALGQIHFDLSPWILIPIASVLGGMPASASASRPSGCVASTSRCPCWPIPWRCSTCSNGWATRKSRYR